MVGTVAVAPGIPTNVPGETDYRIYLLGQEHGPTVVNSSDAEAVVCYLDHLESMPWWDLDLTDNRIEVDGGALTITDKATGDSIGFGTWWALSGGGKVLGDRLDHLSIRAENAPTVGHWLKAEI